MIVFQQMLFFLNLMVTLIFGVDYFVAESVKASPKTKAKMGVLLASLFFVFLVLLTLFAILGAVMKRNALYLGLSFFVVVPFVIGRLASYRTLRLYTVLQILSLLLSAAMLCVI